MISAKELSGSTDTYVKLCAKIKAAGKRGRRRTKLIIAPGQEMTYDEAHKLRKKGYTVGLSYTAKKQSFKDAIRVKPLKAQSGKYTVRW